MKATFRKQAQTLRPSDPSAGLDLGFSEPDRRPVPDASLTAQASRTAPELRTDPDALLATLERWGRLGVAVRPDGELLRASVVAGRLPPEIADEIRALKPALLDYLRTYPCTSCGRSYGFRRPRLCFWCARDHASPERIHA